MIKAGMRLTLESGHRESTLQQTYRCKVVEFTEDVIYISYPLNEETQRSAFLLKGTKLLATFIGYDQNVYTFPTEVTGREIKGMPVVKLFYPGDKKLKSIQRRNFFRVPLTVKAVIESEQEQQNVMEIMTKNISAGGIAGSFHHSLLFNEKDSVVVRLSLPNRDGALQHLELKGEVVRITAPTSCKVGQLSIKFMDMEKQTKEMMIRYTLKCQLDLRRKGLL
ncbi:flagellar brake domain-containing protein [Bacillus sp. FJAT-26377]|nr:flagellar brake domain-containing protein [Bacillus sp. FJAT-26377]